MTPPTFSSEISPATSDAIPPAPVIEITRLFKHYTLAGGDILPVLFNLSLQIQTGEFVSIMGPSGSGKSTLLNILGCLDQPSEGQYRLDQHDTAALSANALADIRHRTLGFVFQGFNLLPRKTAIENVALPLTYGDVPLRDRRDLARQMLDKVNVLELADKYPNQMSGGQQQRVAIARALVNQPRVILADEPTGNLDSRTSKKILRLFSHLHQELGITILIVTHDPHVAEHTQRLISLKDGAIVYDGAPGVVVEHFA